ncbi:MULTISPECIES: hypothetical protein [Limnospira]|uniref:Uncharacterized protein n=1 Tax=Limnospira fusiformis PMC 851.14 TaxID=2219512 RepID=A0ABU9ET05_LIMFS|nr:hypothetical protein [Limnospira sp. PMC 917.15]MDT9234864.1 hypothetical protein [Limnospira sp. PMC 917.15]
MISSILNWLFSSILSWIFGLIVAAVICLIAFPIGIIGLTFNQGITKHSQIDQAIKKAQSEGYIINYDKVKALRNSANSDIESGFWGLFIMFIVYILIFLFIPKFFVASLWGLLPLFVGLLGGFIVPSLDPF